jgi:hypothetical protein
MWEILKIYYVSVRRVQYVKTRLFIGWTKSDCRSVWKGRSFLYYPNLHIFSVIITYLLLPLFWTHQRHHLLFFCFSNTYSNLNYSHANKAGRTSWIIKVWFTPTTESIFTLSIYYAWLYLFHSLNKWRRVYDYRDFVRCVLFLRKTIWFSVKR